jgi:hypothetical protein
MVAGVSLVQAAFATGCAELDVPPIAKTSTTVATMAAGDTLRTRIYLRFVGLAFFLDWARALASTLFWAFVVLELFSPFEAFFATRLLVGIVDLPRDNERWGAVRLSPAGTAFT